MRLLVVRNDKLGDFMLAWPALALLKLRRPEWHITALVPAYTAPMAELCPWIDAVLIDEAEPSLALARKLKRERFDCMLTLFSSGRIARAGWLAHIPYRLAPATKLAQIFYNHRLTQRRSRSDKPEYAYNIDLVRQLLADHRGSPYQPLEDTASDYLPAEIERPLLTFHDDLTKLKHQFCCTLALPEDKQLIFIHPGSGGSANNLRLEQYITLANLLPTCDYAFVISAGPGEEATASQVAAGIEGNSAVYTSSSGLVEFARVLQTAALFISGSTGPLHIAAALNRPTAAFYPRHRSATPLRWQTTNAPERRLAFTPTPEAEADDVQACDLYAAAIAIQALLIQVRE
jgi:ADP-heptose:LPS heptosyltransferase